jgi:hypothetical protein
MVTKRRSKPARKPKQMVQIQTGDISEVDGEVNIAARDIIKNIKTIYQRALTPGEIVEKDLKFEVNELARGIRSYLERLEQQATNLNLAIPYKGLEAYTLSDAEVFFGRDQAISDLRKAIKRGKLTILQAESGAGKTSLLQAGIVPRLIVEKHLAVLIRPQFENPSYAIKKCFLGDLKLTPRLAGTPLVDFLRRVKKIIGRSTLYLVLDQFEEFFSKHTLEEDRQAFIRDLAQCLNDVTLNVRWVLSITADAFGQLGKFEPYILNPFSNVQSLYLLDRDAATAVIARPAKHHHLRIQAGLMERLLDDLSRPQNELIAPTQIQLVCVALYDDLQDHAQVFTLAHYEEKGCAEGILRGYIANVMSSYLPVEERLLGYKILEELVTSEKKRILRSKADLESALESRGIPPDLIESALNHLVSRRLLRRLGDDTEHIQYELVHDYLLNEIELNDDMRRIKEAEELLEQGRRNWKRFNIVLNKDTLNIIGKQRKELRFNHDDICLLLISLAGLKGHSKEWHYYLSLAKKNNYGREISNTLVPFLAQANKALRNQSYTVLWNFVRDCPAPIKPNIILRNLTSWTPVYLGRAILLAFIALMIYEVAWLVSRNQLEKIGWQTMSSLPSTCFSSESAGRRNISADPSDPSNIIVFDNFQSNICQSHDAGSSWTPISNGLGPDLKINSMAVYKKRLILLSPQQVFYWNAEKNRWDALSIPVKPEMEFRSASIGADDHEIFIASTPHEIISLQTTEKCWNSLTKNKTLDERDQGNCLRQIDTSTLAGNINFLSTNEKYIVANTSQGTWFSEIEHIAWKEQPGLDGSISSFALHTQSLSVNGIFVVVLPGRGVRRGDLGIPELLTSDEWPFPSVNGDEIWDWPLNTNAIAVSQNVFFANTADGLQRYPGWSIFDDEWWRIMREHAPAAE